MEWSDFESFWKERADHAENESGDRLSVTMNGHRTVFRRPHDGTVSIDDVEWARHLLNAEPLDKGEGRVLAVTIDNETARIYDFDLSNTDVEDTEHTVHSPDARAHHMRTVEKKTGRDDEHDDTHFFDDIAKALRTHYPHRPYVLFGHGDGKSDAAAGFADRMRQHDHDISSRMLSEHRIDLSAATPADLEKVAIQAAGQ